jgi:hypothetical protein
MTSLSNDFLHICLSLLVMNAHRKDVKVQGHRWDAEEQHLSSLDDLMYGDQVLLDIYGAL